ncbi:hypothetical protein RB195_008561 [Necator americanus]|uniref:RRM domain-containing protein n=1 Tax=Necator americanus TaxID=51031 RepID=A0ABR1CRU9_NECAM
MWRRRYRTESVKCCDLRMVTGPVPNSRSWLDVLTVDTTGVILELPLISNASNVACGCLPAFLLEIHLRLSTPLILSAHPPSLTIANIFDALAARRFVLSDDPIVYFFALFVGGFPASTTELELREHFEQFFTIKEVKVIRSADGVSKGYGFITFDTDDEADTVRGMSPDKLEFKGRKLNLGPALRRMSQRYSTDYAIATPTGLVQSPTYGYTYSFPPQPPFVMVNAPQAYVYAPGSPVPQAMIYPVAAPANPQLTVEQPAANAATNGAANTPDGSPTRATVQNGEVVVPAAAKIPATPPATAASSSLSVVAAPAPPQQPQACIQYPVYVQPQAPPTPITPSVMAHPRGSPSNVYNSPQITSVPSAQYFSNGEGHGMQYQQTFYYNNTPMAAAGDAANMQMMYSNGAPAAPIYGGADYTPQPAQQPHDSPPIAQGLFTPSPHHHGGNPQGGRFIRATPRAVMSLNGQFQSMRVSNEHPKNSSNEAMRTSATPPESPQF